MENDTESEYEYDIESESDNESVGKRARITHLFNEIENQFMKAIRHQESESESDSESVSDGEYDASDSGSWLSLMSEKDIEDLEEALVDMLNDYMESELDNMYMASFEEYMLRDVYHLAASQLRDAGIVIGEEDKDLEELIKHVYDGVRASNSALVPRSRPTLAPISLDESYKRHIDDVLEKIRNNEGQKYKQRTYEWYQYRSGLITASNIWKIFSTSQSSQNSLIYEKCKDAYASDRIGKEFGSASDRGAEVDVDEDAENGVKRVETKTQEKKDAQEKAGHVNTGTAFHWGNKYEPLSIQLYEHKYNTKVAEFGCIRHEKHPFIGASPDGINVCRDSPRYGRMIEVKNIYNRDITGIPKDEYWIQMQFQMETCGLTECDFIETRFKEYENESEFYANEFIHDTRGVIIYFVERNTNTNQTHVNNVNPYYVYMPVNHSLEKECVDAWISRMREEYKSTHHLYEVIYWYLDEFSCVLVDIHKLWLDNAIPKVKTFWDIICREKVSGYEHRGTKKSRNGISGAIGSGTSSSSTIGSSGTGICLIKLDADGNPI